MKNKNNTLYIGIDPGSVSGGIAAIMPSGKATAVKMPQTEHDVQDVFLRILQMGMPVFALIEGVHAFPGQGVSSVFKFGRNYGMLRGMLVANKIPFHEVSPMKWQKGTGITKRGKNETKTQHKNKLKQKAQNIFPDIKMTLAICDALLICEFARLNH